MGLFYADIKSLWYFFSVVDMKMPPMRTAFHETAIYA